MPQYALDIEIKLDINPASHNEFKRIVLKVFNKIACNKEIAPMQIRV